MNNDINGLLEHRLKVNRKRKIIFLIAILVLPAALLIPVKLNQLGVIWFSTLFISIFIVLVAFFLEMKVTLRLKGTLKAAKDKTMVSVQHTHYHLKLFGLTINRQTQFIIKIANNKAFAIMVPQKDAPFLYEAIMEVINQRRYS